MLYEGMCTFLSVYLKYSVGEWLGVSGCMLA